MPSPSVSTVSPALFGKASEPSSVPSSSLSESRGSVPAATSSPSFKYCVVYCYNSNITSQEEAEENFLNMFDV